MFSPFMEETYSADKAVKARITDLYTIIIYKLVGGNYELFQIIEYRPGVPDNLFVSDNGDIIGLKLYSGIDTYTLKYQQRGSKYVKID